MLFFNCVKIGYYFYCGGYYEDVGIVCGLLVNVGMWSYVFFF